MDSNNTETTTSSSSSTFQCEHKRDSWDLNYSTLHFVIDAMALVASLPTILLNAMVILVVKRTKELQKPSTILLSSLAVTDLLIGVIVMPLSAISDILIFSKHPFAYKCMLDLVNIFFMFLLFFATLYHLTIIAWDRYVAIKKWMDYKVIVTNGRVKKLAIAAWLFALFPAVPNVIMAAVDVDRRIVGGWFTFCASMGAVCLILIAFFYRKVYLGIRNRQISEISQVTEQKKAKLESKVAKMTGLLTAALMSTFIPIFGFEILGNFFPIFNSSAAIRFTDTVTQFNSLFNPLLYCYRDQRFRNALRELLGKRKPQALQSAVDVARDRSVRRNDLSASTETQIVETSTTHLTKPVFSNLLAALDSADRRPREVMLKRSMSDQMIDKFSSSIDGLELQQPSPIVVTSATVHAESRVQCEAKKNNPECANGVNKPQVTQQLFPNKPRSKSCDPITSVGLTNLDRKQFAIEEPN